MKPVSGTARVYSLKIAGRDYTIRSADAPEHVHRVAVYTDRKISETAKSGFVNREDAAVISALSLADELFYAQDDNTRLRKELWQLRQEKAERDKEKRRADANAPSDLATRPE